MAWLALAGGLLIVGTSGCQSLDGLNPVTRGGQAVIGYFWVVMIPSALVFLLVAGLLTYALVRFRGRPGDPDPPQTHGNRKLEIIWTILPHLLLGALFVGMVRTMQAVEAEAPQPLQVRVIGHQWWWEFEYTDFGFVTANEPHLPVGVPINLRLESADVIHSFWAPQLGWKRDLIPTRPNEMRIQLVQGGVYDGACTEYCGTQHAWMRLRLIADPPEQFEAWVRQQQQAAAPPQGDAARRGQELFLSNTCVNCHAIRGTPASARVGPDLTHFGSRSIIGAGVVPNTPERLHEWVWRVQSVKPGALMPNYPNLTDDDVRALVEYLEGLK